MAILLKGEHFKPYSSIAEVLALPVEEFTTFFHRLDNVRAVLLFCACMCEDKIAADKYYDFIRSRVFALTAPHKSGSHLGLLLILSYSFLINARGYVSMLELLSSIGGLKARPEEELRHLEALIEWLKVQEVPEVSSLLVGQLIDAFSIQLEEMPFN
jgi:hypothetical protein